MPTATTDGASPKLPAFVRSLRWAVIALLVLSTALTLVGVPELQREVAAGRWPGAALAIPPAFLTLFVLGFAGYRLVLVRAGRYPAGKALVQLGLMVLVLAVMAGIALDRPRSTPAGQPVDLARALASTDPDTRALAAELVRHRPRADGLGQVLRLVALLDDPAPQVRRQAHASLVALAGSDAGGDGPGAADRWREYWRRAGVLR